MSRHPSTFHTENMVAEVGKRARQQRCFVLWLRACLDCEFQGLPLSRMFRKSRASVLAGFVKASQQTLLTGWPRPLQPQLSKREVRLCFKRFVDRHLVCKHKGVCLPIGPLVRTVSVIARNQRTVMYGNDDDLAFLPSLRATPTCRKERICDALVAWLYENYVVGVSPCSYSRSSLLKEANAYLESFGLTEILSRNSEIWRAFLHLLRPKINPSGYRGLRIQKKPPSFVEGV